MQEAHTYAQWRAIDQTSSPVSFIHFMDMHNQLEDAQSADMMQTTFQSLDVQPGKVFLDAGCGTGEHARALVEYAQVPIQVVGVDTSETMIEEARRRNAGPGTAITYTIGDASQLPFTDNAYDGCYAIGLIEMVARPADILGEMVRVTRSGGNVVIPTGDMGTWIIDTSYLTFTHEILHFFADTAINGYLGRQLPRLFHECGLTNIRVRPATYIVSSFAQAYQLWLGNIVRYVQEANIFPPEALLAWVQDLEKRAQAGSFFMARTVFFVAGSKP